MNFKEELKNYQNIINNEMKKYLNKENVPEKKLNESKEYSLMADGKRLRPILVLATYELFDKNIESCLPYAVAIEMIHNFSLIHDDLPGIDNDNFRHGKPTNHRKFNEATAILAGDALFNQAYIVISEDLKNTKQENLNIKLQILNEFTKSVDRMIIGEFVDTEFEGKEEGNKYLEYIHKNKTAELLKLCVRMGALLANTSNENLEKLTSYAEKIGLAFQIKDDILSEEGDEKILGKPVGNDKKLEKQTYVLKYGLDGSKKILETVIQDAIAELDIFGEKAEFLKELAIYIKDRDK